MANDAAHYRELAARAHSEANQAALDNVRDRALRSAAAFESMALQHERAAKRRVEREASTEDNAAHASIDEAPIIQPHKDQT